MKSNTNTGSSQTIPWKTYIDDTKVKQRNHPKKMYLSINKEVITNSNKNKTNTVQILGEAANKRKEINDVTDKKTNNVKCIIIKNPSSSSSNFKNMKVISSTNSQNQPSKTQVVQIPNQSQNRDYFCPSCHKLAMDNTIACDKCQNWYHFECEGISQDKAKQMNDKIPYSCNSCRNILMDGFPTNVYKNSSSDSNKQNKSMVKQLEARIKNLEKQMLQRDNEIQYLKEQNTFLQSNTLRLEQNVKNLQDTENKEFTK